MILRHIHLYNFKKYKKASISFSNSMIGIFGNNGAGKSSLFEAITWCLYGIAQSMEGKEGINQKDLIRDGQEEMGVEVEFSLAGHTYKVARYLHAKKGIKSRLWIEGKLQTVKAKEVISRVEQDLGLNVKGFISSSFIRQKELDLITSAIASERKRLINRLFNLRVYEQFEEETKTRKKEKETDLKIVLSQIEEKEKLLKIIPEMEKELEEMEKMVRVLTSDYENVKNESESIKKEYLILEKEYNHYVAMQSQLKLIENDMENLEKALEEKKNEWKKIEEAESKKEALASEYGNLLNLKGKLSELEKLKSDYDAKTTQMQALQTEISLTQKNIEERIAEYQKETKELQIEEEELGESKNMLLTIREKITEYESIPQQVEEEKQKLDKIREKEGEILTEKAQYTTRMGDLQKELEEIHSIGIGAPCPTCKRPLEKEHLETLVARYGIEINSHQKLKEKCESKEKHLTEMRTELENVIEELKKKENVLNNLRKEEQQYVQAEMRIEDLRKRIKDFETKIVEGENNLIKLEEKKKEVLILKEEIKILKFDPSEYERVKKEVEEKTPIEHEIIKLEERILKKKEVLKSISGTEEKLNIQKNEKEKLEAEIQKKSEISSQFEDIKGKRDTITQKELEISKKYIEIRTKYEERKKELERLYQSKEELIDIKKKQKETEAMITTYSVLQDAFKQIPVQIQSRLRPRIRKETSELLNEVTEGKYPFIDLGKDYSLTVYYDGTYYPISRFSGGEKDLINLCLRVGISRVLVSLSSQKSFARVQSLFLDECFGSFDVERRKNLLAALNELRKYFAQIVLITHIEEIKEALPEAFLVEEMEDGSSLIKKIK